MKKRKSYLYLFPIDFFFLRKSVSAPQIYLKQAINLMDSFSSCVINIERFESASEGGSIFTMSGGRINQINHTPSFNDVRSEFGKIFLMLPFLIVLDCR